MCFIQQFTVSMSRFGNSMRKKSSTASNVKPPIGELRKNCHLCMVGCGTGGTNCISADERCSKHAGPHLSRRNSSFGLTENNFSICRDAKSSPMNHQIFQKMAFAALCPCLGGGLTRTVDGHVKCKHSARRSLRPYVFVFSQSALCLASYKSLWFVPELTCLVLLSK